MLDKIEAELRRLSADRISLRLDDEFEPNVGTLLRIQLGEAYWHMPPEHFLELLKDLPGGLGNEATRRAIERKATFVWHGPSPEGSRDTTT